ncbi:MAG TPA: error-prone DNA polymerase [Rhizomicrobium sp.]|nr:error-prone DNA polymerase [Rhizomicrobium sp.]
MTGYAELAVTSNFSFLRGASHPEEHATQAAALGLAGLGIADRNSVAGVVRAHSIAKEKGLRLGVGARLVFADGVTPDILAYPSDAAAWSRLTRLLSIGKQRAPKGECHLGVADLLEWQDGMNLIVMPPAVADMAPHLLARLREAAPERVWLGASHLYRGDDARRMAKLAAAGRAARVPLVATNDVQFHHPDRRPLADVLTCIREHTTLDAAGRLLAANAERHLKPATEMARLFRDYPGAVEETLHFLGRCNFSLEKLRPSYPLERREGFATPMEALVAFAEDGAKRRYPGGVPDKIRSNLDYEYKLVAGLNYAPYFLTVHEIVRFARSKGILCQGRGSAANSTICYCLGVTEVDPMVSGLLFERFISAQRGEPPDIDVDFEHERREEVIQHIYDLYGRERAAMTAVTTCYRGRSAIREVCKVFGLSADVAARLAKTLWGWSNGGVADETADKSGLDTADPRLKQALALARELIDFPRHLSQHVGGFVITEGRLDAIVPIENAAMEDRTVIEWNKDDLEALRILKVDVLGLGMLSCLRRAFGLMQQHYGLSYTATSALPEEEPEVYRMLSRADTIGVFQVESRAQMSMLPRLKPKEFYDLVVEVAIVRPGPIQGNMVHPYLKRRQGLEPVSFPSPHPDHGPADELEQILSKTCGVPLFQEQAMKIAIVAAKFAPDEADRLRRAMATFKRVGTIDTFREKFVTKMVERGYPQEFAANCFSQIQGFGEYGFPESHAASFALLVYASGWIKCHHPDVFACALLNSQPMGFYAAGQLVRDAQEHGVSVRPPDINHSHWDSTLESAAPGTLHHRHVDMRNDLRTAHALRLGLRQIGGFSEEEAKKIMTARDRPFGSIRDLWLRTGLTPISLRQLAMADAFGSLGLSRREALWAVRAMRRVADKDDLPLLSRMLLPPQEQAVALPVMTQGQEVVEDYTHLSLSLKTHPVTLLRPALDAMRVHTNAEFLGLPDGARACIAGLVLVRQHPGSAKSIFMTLEDETAAANVMVWPKIFEAYRPIVMGARMVAITGRVQSESGVIHLIAEDLKDLTPLLRSLKDGDTVEDAMPKGRNFH